MRLELDTGQFCLALRYVNSADDGRRLMNCYDSFFHTPAMSNQSGGLTDAHFLEINPTGGMRVQIIFLEARF